MTPRFHSHPLVREVSDDCWRLEEPLAYDSAVLDRTVTVPVGFTTDFYSIPRWLPLAYAVLSGGSKGPAILHDFFYQTHKVRRATADRVLYEAMEAVGIPLWKRGPIYAGVRLGGWVPWSRHTSDTCSPLVRVRG